jgi:ElaB/YqjD/DUF883 family membrane-anchored ribosome-binding protein
MSSSSSTSSKGRKRQLEDVVNNLKDSQEMLHFLNRTSMTGYGNRKRAIHKKIFSDEALVAKSIQKQPDSVYNHIRDAVHNIINKNFKEDSPEQSIGIGITVNYHKDLPEKKDIEEYFHSAPQKAIVLKDPLTGLLSMNEVDQALAEVC